MKTLTLETIEIGGNRRTDDRVITDYLDLVPGQELKRDTILAAIQRLQAAEILDDVDYYTRPGDRRGAVVLVLEVQERNPRIQLGTGNTDLDGWYLIPAELNLDNVAGKGERLALQLRFGYRLNGIFAHYLRGEAPRQRSFWGLRAHGYTADRIYFDEGTEFAHEVSRNGLDFHFGRKLGGGLSLAVGLRAETVEVDSTSSVYRDNEPAGRSEDDTVPFAELPAAVAAAVGERESIAWRADLVLDTRSELRRAGTPVSGLWGRLRFEHMQMQEWENFVGASLDLRTYRGLGAGALAVGAKAAVVEDAAPFTHRHYLGGLYTVRGFPSQSLSEPGGGRRIWHSTVEYRAPLAGRGPRPRLVGSLFVDAGGRIETGETVAVGAGYGVRLSLGSIGYLGADMAFPLTDSPVDESFHGHVSLGWKF